MWRPKLFVTSCNLPSCHSACAPKRGSATEPISIDTVTALLFWESPHSVLHPRYQEGSECHFQTFVGTPQGRNSRCLPRLNCALAVSWCCSSGLPPLQRTICSQVPAACSVHQNHGAKREHAQTKMPEEIMRRGPSPKSSPGKANTICFP